MADNYTYETKCRRCGNITDWHFSDSAAFTWFQFATAMQDYINNPRLSECKTCDKKTVQDVVAYTGPHG